MTNATFSTLMRGDKGPLAPPPALNEPLQVVAAAVAAWPGVEATTHWHLSDQGRVDGVDFYVDAAELGHIHLDGVIHLATPPDFGAALVAEGEVRPFPYAQGWVTARVGRIGADAAVALFRRNYMRITNGIPTHGPRGEMSG